MPISIPPQVHHPLHLSLELELCIMSVAILPTDGAQITSIRAVGWPHTESCDRGNHTLLFIEILSGDPARTYGPAPSICVHLVN